MLNKIKNLVIEKTGVDIERDTRIKKYAEARAMYYYLCREYTRESFRKIGQSLELKKDHATVYHSCSMLDVYLMDSKSNREVFKNMDSIIKSYLENNCNDFKEAEGLIVADRSKYNELLQTIYKIPEDYIETVKQRLDAIIKCLPKT